MHTSCVNSRAVDEEGTEGMGGREEEREGREEDREGREDGREKGVTACTQCIIHVFM